MWKYYALMSASFAALTAIFAKVGLNKGINADLATAIRTLIILLLTWGIVFAGGHDKEIKTISSQVWLFLLLSGFSTGLSWLFYFKALQDGDAARVAALDKLSLVMTAALSFILLKEQCDLRTVLGLSLITIGGLVILIK